MRFVIDTPIIGENIPTYIIVKQHRLHVNNRKSRWTIDNNEEYECFKVCHSKKWIMGSYGWGLHLVGNRPSKLGVSREGLELMIAKFEENSGSDVYWHGYPVDYRDKKRNSCPPETILKDWVTRRIISKPQMLRMMGGRKCAL